MIEIEKFEVDTPKERRDAAEHRRRILVAARKLFAQQGVDATSMTEIARSAKIGQGTLYRRFAHKGELCEALLQENMQLFQNELEALFVDDVNTTALERLDLLFARFMAFNEQNYPLVIAIVDSSGGHRRGEFFQSPYYRQLYATFVRLLEQGIAAQEIHAIDVNLVAHLMIGAFKGNLPLCQRHQLGYSSDQILQALRGLLIDGLRVRE